MKTNRFFYSVVFSVIAIVAIFGIALNLEGATEFSPDLLMFRGAWHICGIRTMPGEQWSTPLLDEARAKYPMPEEVGRVRWNYVHGNNAIGRARFTNGDAKPAYRFFRSGVWDDVLTDPKNKRDDIIKSVVNFMRQEKYNDAAEFLYEAKFGEK